VQNALFGIVSYTNLVEQRIQSHSNVNSEWKFEKKQNLVFENKKDEVVNHIANQQFENQPNVIEKQRNLNDLNGRNDVDSLSNQDEKSSKVEM
jgi:hypothetical protein